MNQIVGFGDSAKVTVARLSRRLSFLAVGGFALIVVACGGSSGDLASTITTQQQVTDLEVAVPSTPEPTVSPATPEPTLTPTAVPEPTSEPMAESTPDSEFSDLFSDDAEKSRAQRLTTIWGWETNLAERTIPLTELEIVLAKDRIVPVDAPMFVPVADAPTYMEPREPVVALVVDGDARAYPLAILMWHEIVNDTVGGVPVTVTFCPLCNTGITFERTVGDQELTFGTSGMLRNSDLVMWDRQTQSFWQQITGEALAGDFAANETVLAQLPSSIMAWETFVSAYPDGQLLEREVNEYESPVRPYDSPPYAGYDNVDQQPFLFRGAIDDRLVATSRVLTVDGENPVAYPFSFLEEFPVVNDKVGDEDIVAFFDNGTFSAFNDRSDSHQTSGSVTVFSRKVDDELLTFEASDSGITEIETGSNWNLAGIAIDGELTGTQLSAVVHGNHFWFSWAVFKPTTEIRSSMADLAS